MRVFKEKSFARFARKEGIAQDDLCRAAEDVVSGRFDAGLGQFLFKQRVARRGQGKSRGYRTIIGYRRPNSNRIVFLYGFPKSARSNISSAEEAALAVVANAFVTATDAQIDALKAAGAFLEIEC